MRTIVITLCNNDFSSTFVNLLATIRGVIAYNPQLKEEEIVSIIKSGITFHYLAFSNCFKSSSGDFERTASYLRNNIEILFDEKAEDKILHTDHDGGSYYLNLQDSTIGSF